VLPPDVLNKFFAELSDKVKKLTSEGHLPIVLCSPNVRRLVKKLTEKNMPNLVVLSYTEIPNQVKIRSVGVIRRDRDEDTKVSSQNN